jgi:nitroreductase/NAD-dependent dihydropyrimidine dehydrogenase PreA subunit
MIRIDEETCTKCNICIQHCPAGIIAEGPEIIEELQKYCILCGHCSVVCPSDAVRMIGFEDVKVPSYAKEIPISSQSLETLLRRRRSVRHYKTEPVSRKHLEKIIEAASLVSSAHNYRAFRAYVCTDRAVISQIHHKVTAYFTQYVEALKNPIEGMPDAAREDLLYTMNYLAVNPPGGRDSIFWNANALLLFTTTNNHALCIGDAWTASFAAIMYAETIPVGTCYNGLLLIAVNEDPSIKSLLKIPEGELVVSGFTLGYPDEAHFRYPPRRPMQTVWV